MQCEAYCSGVSRKENIFSLCALCVSSPADGGMKNALERRWYLWPIIQSARIVEGPRKRPFQAISFLFTNVAIAGKPIAKTVAGVAAHPVALQNQVRQGRFIQNDVVRRTFETRYRWF